MQVDGFEVLRFEGSEKEAHTYICIYIYIYEHCFFLIKNSSTDMDGLRKLRGMVVFPVEETTRGYSCYSGDYADYAAHLAYKT